MRTRPFPSFYIYIGDDDLYHWHYQYLANHRVEAGSAEGYKSYDECRAGIDLVKAAWGAPVWLSAEVSKRQKANAAASSAVAK